MPVTNSTNLVHLNTHTGNEKSITNGNRKAPAGKSIGDCDYIFYIKKKPICINFSIVEITLLIFYLVSDGGAMRPLLEDHSERTYQTELDRMNSTAGMVELNEVNTSAPEKQEEPKEKF